MSDGYKHASSVYDFSAKDIKGEEVSLRKYEGKVLIIVNIASKCGLTDSNYEGLTALEAKYNGDVRVLAFPCNQFLSQEPGTPDEICSFAANKKATFEIFEKINVNGEDAHPLWKYLKFKQGGVLGSTIKWNFTKFLINKSGQPVKRFGPQESFQKIEDHVRRNV